LQEQTKRWQEEWQRQLQQQQRELREEIHRGLRAPKPRGDARVV
jgi:hypothetical protein